VLQWVLHQLRAVAVLPHQLQVAAAVPQQQLPVLIAVVQGVLRVLVAMPHLLRSSLLVSSAVLQQIAVLLTRHAAAATAWLTQIFKCQLLAVSLLGAAQKSQTCLQLRQRSGG
jgi:hypothetical protein